MSYRLPLYGLLLLLSLGSASLRAQHPDAASPPPGGYPLRQVSELTAVPVPPGGLVPYRNGPRWGYADTTGRVWIQPQRWVLPQELRPFWGGYGLVRQQFPEQLPPAAALPRQLWLNARGEALFVHHDEVAIRQPDGSLRAVPVRRAVGQSELREPHWAAPAPPLLSPERVEVFEGHPTDWQDLNKPRYRLEYLHAGRWTLQRRLGPARRWYDPRPRSNGHGYGLRALLTAQGRLTRYRFAAVERFQAVGRGVARVEAHDFRIGLIDRQGHWLLRPRYRNVSPFYRGLAVARGKSSRGQPRAGILDSVGRWQWRPRPGHLSNLDDAGLVRATEPAPATGPVRFRRPDGSVPFANSTFLQAGPFWQNRAWVEVAPGQQGLIDRQGQWVTPARYDLLTVAERMDRPTLRRPTLQREFIDGADGPGLDTYSSGTYIEPRYPETPWLLARREGRYGFVDRRSGQEVVPCRYDSVLTVPEGAHRSDRLQPFVCAWRQGRPYVLNMRGEELTEGRYEGRMLHDAGGVCLLLRRPADSTWAAIDTTGRPLTAWLPGGLWWGAGYLLPQGLALTYDSRSRTWQVLDAATGRLRLAAARIEVDQLGLRAAAAPRRPVLRATDKEGQSRYYDEQVRPLREADMLMVRDVGGGWLLARRLPEPFDSCTLLISPQNQRLQLPPGNAWWPEYESPALPGPFQAGVARTRLGYLTRGGRQLWQD